MPPRSGSRYQFCVGVRDRDEQLYLTERVPYRYTHHADTRVHVVAQGATLWSLAGFYFSPLPRACGYWWVIADFQPQPVVDPTLALEPGQRVYVPSVRVLTDIVLGTPSHREAIG